MKQLANCQTWVVNSSGDEVNPKPIGAPVIFHVNQRPYFPREDQYDNQIETITRNVPDGANVYMKSANLFEAPVIVSPIWDYLAVQYYKI